VTWLSDDAVARLRDITELPEVSGTRYQIVRELGRGGMGVVYEAWDAELQRNVAMKVVNIALTDVDRLRREARILAALEHPGIVPVHDVGVLPDGRLFYTMKLVRGTRLDEWVKTQHTRTEVLRLFARVCESVAFAHANGVVHRDLKPENVMVGEFGAVLVMDWGVAQATSETAERIVVGTPGYMAPEQARGEAAGAASDVYALGALLMFLLRGGVIPRPLSAIAARAMSTDPAARYPDARTLGDDVLRYLDGESVTAYRENVFERIGRWADRNRVLLVLVAAYIAMRVVVFFWMRL
jgi:serine/threonine-protein kinase